MNYEDLTAVRVLADSTWMRAAFRPQRITTFELTIPRSVLAEFNTHCQLARNSASSRAIPFEKLVARVREHPFVPQQFSRNQKGMQASEFWRPGDYEYEACADLWIAASLEAASKAEALHAIGVHKQDVNRLLEPFLYHTVIATATWEYWDWPNFIRLRASDQADPKISKAAYQLAAVAESSTPKVLGTDEWHLPLTGFPGDETLELPDLVRVSAARCARVSYLTHDGIRDVEADLGLYRRLAHNEPPHLSPLEHPARPFPGRTAKYTGWRSARYYAEKGEL